MIFVGLGFLTVAAGALFMRSRDRPGRIVMVAGATLMLAGMIWQTFGWLF
tara:strand:- start:88804 stop:88953 length:150 start_codon:yes stop_codon:yes gene_type:complete